MNTTPDQIQKFANSLISPMGFEVKTVEQDNGYLPMMYEELPAEFQKEMDDLAAELVDPDRGHVAIIGSAQSGKTFLLNNLVGNFDRYMDRLGREPMNFIRLNEDDLNLIKAIPNGYNTYIKALTEHFGSSESEICFVTENHNIAAKIHSWSSKVRILLEANRSTFLHIFHTDNEAGNKLWGSWLYTDMSDVLLTKKDLINTAYEALNERVRETFKIDLSKKIIAMFVSHSIRKMPELVIREGKFKGKISVPLGLWLVAFRRMAGIIGLSGSKSLQGKDGNVALGKVISSIYEDNEEIFEMYVEAMSETDHMFENGGGFVIPGPDGQMIRIHLAPGLHINGEDLDEDDSDEDDDKPHEKLSFKDIDELGDSLKREVIGQDEAVQRIVDGLIVPAAGLSDPTKPIRSMLFLGPTGVGKTKMATTLAETLMDEPMNLVRIDMSEYSQSHEAAKLLGAPPGYAGFEQGGVLTNAVKAHPRSLILLDEVEKAHPKIWDSFLQILDAGRMTDGRGQEVDFTQTVVIMTSNIGAKEMQHISVGFGKLSEKEAYNIRQTDSKKVVMRALEEAFRPEMLNRIDEVVGFNEISRETAMLIIQKELGIISDRMAGSGCHLNQVSTDILDEVLTLSDITKYGARDIQRVILKKISNPIAKNMVKARGNEEKVSFSLVIDKDKTISVEAN